MSSVVDEVIIVTNKEKYQLLSRLYVNTRIVADICTNKGALGGIYTGIKYSDSENSIVVACDMPFINLSILKYMLNQTTGYDAVVPQIGNYMEPLHAIYSKSCIPIIEDLIELNELSIYRLIKMVRTRFISENEIRVYDENMLTFFNINNLEDLENAQSIVKKLDRK